MSGRELFVRTFNRQSVPKPSTEFYQLGLPSGKLDVEIGCGVGKHPTQYAVSNPGRHLLAIEHTYEKYVKFKKNIIKAGSPENLMAIHANAISWVTHMLSPKQVERYFILYPNPNPKAGDFRKRWHCMPFMEVIIETLVDKGELTIATNCDFYAEEARRYLCDYWGLKLLLFNRFDQHQMAFEPRTHFEQKYLKDGQSCYDLRFCKV